MTSRPLSTLVVLSFLVQTGCSQPEEGPTGPTTPAAARCDGLITWYRDRDADGYGNPDDTSSECVRPDGFVALSGDCDDTNRRANPGEVEVCDDDNVDENCDGLADNNDPNVTETSDFWPDNDSDGYGDENAAAVQMCDESDTISANNEDCDDTEAGAYPGAAFEESAIECRQDADGDGYGSSSPGGTAIPGGDCDDANPLASPGELEVWLDGIDQNCNGFDDFGYLDDFEDADLDLTQWEFFNGGGGLVSTYAAQGSQSLDLRASGAIVQSQFADSQACTDLSWSYDVQRGPNPPGTSSSLVLEAQDANGDWIEVDRLTGTGGTDSFFSRRSGTADATAFTGPLSQVRLLTTGTQAGSFYVDNFFFGCPGVDNDGDGIAGLLDCDDNDDAHWSDCGTCQDADGDDYGTDCDLGYDCDDGDSSVSPAAADGPGDGVDTNCDGWDGAAFLDTFELASPDPRVWQTLTGDAQVVGGIVPGGAYALQIGDASSEATTKQLNASACPQLNWQYTGLRVGIPAPRNDESVQLEYETSAGWVVADAWFGVDEPDTTTIERSGVITDPNALWSDLRFRLTSTSSGAAFLIDDLVVGCALDADGDDVSVVTDCDDADPWHWSDCGRCVDMDGDGFGVYCDLGIDCDDMDPFSNPLAEDLFQDGVDQNCDGTDLTSIVDNFETGDLDLSTWDVVAGNAEVTTDRSANLSRWSLRLDGDGATVESTSIPTDSCVGIGWKANILRGPAAPSTSTILELQAWTGGAWYTLETVPGTVVTDTEWMDITGFDSNPGLLTNDFKIRLLVTGPATSGDAYFVDNLAVACATPDTDGDGYPPPLDCNDSDRQQWSDCWTCIDQDGDGYGNICDNAPSDCDPLDPLINPGAGEIPADGIDQNCDGVDGTSLFEDFETGSLNPDFWQSISGDGYVGVDESYQGSYSMNLGGNAGTATSAVWNATACQNGILIGWMGKRGPETPDSGDDISLEWWNGTQWTGFTNVWFGIGSTDTSFTYQEHYIVNSGAYINDFQLRLNSVGSGANFDDFFFDNMHMGCLGTDNDGDGWSTPADCNDQDASLTDNCP